MNQIFESAPRAFRKGVEYLKKGKKEKGASRFATSLKAGFKPAMVIIDIIDHEEDVNQAVVSFETLFKNGFKGASLAIGKFYYEGNGRPFSREESVKWFLESARDGGVEACNYIGEMRECGEGLPVDLNKAFEWYERGAQRGDIVAKFNIGRLLSTGDGGYKDINEAVDNWYESAKGGYAPAMYKVGEIFEEGLTVPVKLSKSFEWYLKAANAGYAPAFEKAGMFLYDGKGVEKNAAEAFLWLTKMEGIASSGVALILGKMYLRGEGTPKDLNKAKEYLQQAAQSDFVEAIFLMGQLFDELGDPEAYDWYHRAADKGSADAQDSICSSAGCCWFQLLQLCRQTRFGKWKTFCLHKLLKLPMPMLRCKPIVLF